MVMIVVTLVFHRVSLPWYRILHNLQHGLTDPVPHHYPNRQARPTADGVAQFVSFEEDPSAPNLRRQFWTFLTNSAPGTVRDL